jgi:hypothetical protein
MAITGQQAQHQAQIDSAKLQQQFVLAQQKAQNELEIERIRAANDMAIEQMKTENAHQLALHQASLAANNSANGGAAVS